LDGDKRERVDLILVNGNRVKIGWERVEIIGWMEIE